MTKDKIRIGTRGSNLALIQAGMVKSSLERANPSLDIELVRIRTTGDIDTGISLSKAGGISQRSFKPKGLFIKEIEEALMDGKVDIAVHSLKDLPAELPDSLALASVLERGDARDAFVSNKCKSIDELAAGSVVATSSSRRRAQLTHYYPHLALSEMRGNLDTRLRKLDEGGCDAMVLAACGLIRAGFSSRICEYLPQQKFIPAVCQGIIGIEIRKDDKRIAELADSINHEATYRIAIAERTFMQHLEGGCQVPMGCYSVFDGDRFFFTAFMSDPKGGEMIICERDCERGAESTIASLAAKDILLNGGQAIREKIKEQEENK